MVLGITGISGAGKHTVGEFLKQKGWVVLDADKIAHSLYRPYTGVWKAIVKEFGEDVLTQKDLINRVKLGKIVFNASKPKESAAALAKLNQIVHPYLRRKIKNDIHRHFRRKSNIAVVVALWRESGLEACCEKLLLIKSKPELMEKRIQMRDGISTETYQMRVKNQEEPKQPDFIINNKGSKQALLRELDDVLEYLTKKDEK